MKQPVYICPQTSQVLFWEDLIDLLTAIPEYLPARRCSSPTQVYLQLIQSLIYDAPVVLLDIDYSMSEIHNYAVPDGLLYEKITKKISYPDSYQTFVKSLFQLKDWSMTLFTSGTTGKPKSVVHKIDTLIRGVRVTQENLFNIWGWAYNPTHMAGIQVFFQAILNGNPLVLLWGLSRESILDAISKYHITHLSATPTYYRMLLPIDSAMMSLKYITFGGERIDNNLLEEYKSKLTNTKFRNIYATTEVGSLFISEGIYFKIPEKYKNFIRITDKQLFIHASLLGYSESLQTMNNWYNTGDIVEPSPDDPSLFQFVYRKSDIINVGGYNVNPYEVEDVLNSYPGVEHSKVYGKKSSVTGNLVAADVVVSDLRITEKELRAFLKEKLQDFKIPRFIQFVKHIDLTRTGKISRL